MTVSAAGRAPLARATTRRRGGVGAVYRVEIAKIAAQLLPRVVLLVCLVGPLAFTVFISTQSTVPADSLLGRWVHTSGFAVPFVVLQFVNTLGFPLIASVVAGDIFAGEDRQSTWKTILTRSCSRRDIFWAKTWAACTYSIAMVVVIAASSLIAGLLVVGHDQLIGLSGAPIHPGRATVLVVESFAIALAPTLAFTCIGIFFSVTSRNSVVGILGPLVVGLVMLLLSLLGSGVIVRAVLLPTAVEAWHGLQIPGSTPLPLLLGLLVSAAYAVLSLDAARRSFLRRDFAGDGQIPVSWPRLKRRVLVGVGVVALLVAGSLLDETWITSKHVESSVGQTFKNLVVVQQGLLGRKLDPRSVRVYPFCKREGVVSGPSKGAADDWTCTLYANAPRVSQMAVDYTIAIRPNGCYTADGPPDVIGPLHITTARGASAINPLSAFDGCMIAP